MNNNVYVPLINTTSSTKQQTSAIQQNKVGAQQRPTRQSSQRNKTSAANSSSNVTPQSQFSQRMNQGTAQKSSMQSTFSPNLNLYSNYLMNQASSALSPTNAVAAQQFNSTTKASGSGLLTATTIGTGNHNVSVRVKKMKQVRNAAHHQSDNIPQSLYSVGHRELQSPPSSVLQQNRNGFQPPQTAGSKTRTRGQAVNTQQAQYQLAKTAPFNATQINHINSSSNNNTSSAMMNIDRHSLILHNIQQQSMPQMGKAKLGAHSNKGHMLLVPQQKTQRVAPTIVQSGECDATPSSSFTVGTVANSDTKEKAMKVSNTTSQDTTVIFLNNKLGSGIKKEVVANSDPNFADIEQINEPVDQVYLIGGNFDKKNYASGTAGMANRQTKTIFDYSSQNSSSAGGAGNQATSGNFIFQPVLTQSSNVNVTAITAGSATFGKTCLSKHKTSTAVVKESCKNALSGRNSSNNNGSNKSRKASSHSGQSSQQQQTNSNLHLTTAAKSNFYKQVGNRNSKQPKTEAFSGSRESLRKNSNTQQYMLNSNDCLSASSSNQKQQQNQNLQKQQQQIQQQQLSASDTQLDENEAANNSAINNYMMQTFATGDVTPAKNQELSPNKETNVSQIHQQTRKLQEQQQAAPQIAMTFQRNIQTSSGQRIRPNLKSNLVQAQNNKASSRHKILKRHNKFNTNENTVGSAKTGQAMSKSSKNPSRSPHGVQKSSHLSLIGNATGTITCQNQMETLPAEEDEEDFIQQDLNLTMVQAEGLDQVPRDSYNTVNHAGGIQNTLTQEFLNSDTNGPKAAEVFYHSSNSNIKKALFYKDQQQTYFTSDSHEKIGAGQAINNHQHPLVPRHKTESLNMQGSPRTSYYSPQRNQSQPKNLWLNDTFPLSSPQRKTLTPHHPASLGSRINAQQANARLFQQQQTQKLVGVTQLGTSYDFNKLKKNLDSVENRNQGVNTQILKSNQKNNNSRDGSTPQVPQNKHTDDRLEDGSSSSIRPEGNSASVLLNLKQEQDKKQEINDQKLLAQKEERQDRKKDLEKRGEEIIIFSENHSIDDYIVGKEIGKGAYATVHAGIHKRYNKKVALKIYIKDKMKDLQRKKSVRREIKLMRRLDHPNIAKLFDAVETDSQVILVMEYVGGGSTHGFLKSKLNRQMEESEAKRIFSQLISALNYLHSKCIAHRDIKLENVMLDHRGHVKLIDFGFSTQIPNTQKIKLFCGTPSYMAPEIVKKIEFCGPPADIYASGVLLFAFFCGCFPYRGKDDKDLYKKIANDDLVIPDHVPQSPKMIIARMLQKDPECRPTAQELHDEAWVKAGLFSISAVKSRKQTRSNSIKRRDASKNKPSSPSYIPGQKVMTPLSDQKMHQQQILSGIVYDSRKQPQNLHRPSNNANNNANYRVVVTSDSSARSNKTYFMNNTTRPGQMRSPRDYLSPTSQFEQQQKQQQNSGGNTSARGLAQQRMNKKRLDQYATNPQGVKFNTVQQQDLQSQQQQQLQQQQATDIPFTVTKHNGNTITTAYGVANNANNTTKPSTPVYIGRYKNTAKSSSNFTQRSSKQQASTATQGSSHPQKKGVISGGQKQLTQTNKDQDSSIKTMHTARYNKNKPNLVVDNKPDMILQIDSSRGDTTNRRMQLVSTGENFSSPTATNSSSSRQGFPVRNPISPLSSDRFPGRKQSGPASFYNSEAYKAYYTHSAANNAGSSSSSSGQQQQQQPSTQPNIAQEGPIQSGQQQSAAGSNSHNSGGDPPHHQTINNNINIINYITTIACSHPSHEGMDCKKSQPMPPQSTQQNTQHHQQQQEEATGARNINKNWSNPIASTEALNLAATEAARKIEAGGVYSPTGKVKLQQSTATFSATAKQKLKFTKL